MAVVTGLAMVVLVAVTSYYALQTGATVKELRVQREEATRQDRERRVRETLGLRNGLRAELRQILAMLEAPPEDESLGRLYIRLPSKAWEATFGYPDALSAELQESLLQIHSEVGRMNALAEMALSTFSGEARSYPLGTFFPAEERRRSSAALATAVRAALDMVDTLPPPT
jgi:hypothetical protein